MKIMTVPRLLLLLLVVINAITAAEEVPKCNHAQLTVYGTILPGDEPCTCGEETICHPHEMCVPYGLAQCYAAPCDDLSGRWIWYGRNPRPWTEGDFAVWATVEIEQDDCRFVLTSSSNVGSGGLVSDEIRTRKYYGVLVPLELTSFYLFDTREDMDDYESSSPGDDVEEDGATGVQWYMFTQDFGNGAPEVQCSLYGSLVYKGFTSDALADDADSFDGTLARDVEGSFSVGDTIAADGDWNGNGGGCPKGYPKPWGGDGKPTNTPRASSPSPTSDAAVSWQRTAITATILKLSVTINLVMVLLL